MAFYVRMLIDHARLGGVSKNVYEYVQSTGVVGWLSLQEIIKTAKKPNNFSWKEAHLSQ